MSLKHLNTALVTVAGLFVVFIGARFLLMPEAAAAAFGTPEWPHGGATAYLAIKGVRDLVTGLVVLTLLLAGQRRALAWMTVVVALIPVGDAIIVLSSGGSLATALGVHLATAVAVVVTGALLFWETRPGTTVASPESAQVTAGR